MIRYRARSKYMRCMSDGEKCGNSFRKYKMINRVYLRNIQNKNNNKKQPENNQKIHKILYFHNIYNIYDRYYRL